jgi:hypothetical protein
MPVVEIDTGRIVDWDSFHDVFAESLGFPAFYGRNMDAWIDCVTDADAPESGMMSPTAGDGDVLVLRLSEGGSEFAARCPEQAAALHECAAFVNWRRLEAGERAIVCIASP